MGNYRPLLLLTQLKVAVSAGRCNYWLAVLCRFSVAWFCCFGWLLLCLLALWVSRYIGWLLWVGRCRLAAMSGGRFVCGVVGRSLLVAVGRSCGLVAMSVGRFVCSVVGRSWPLWVGRRRLLWVSRCEIGPFVESVLGRPLY